MISHDALQFNKWPFCIKVFDSIEEILLLLILPFPEFKMNLH